MKIEGTWFVFWALTLVFFKLIVSPNSLQAWANLKGLFSVCGKCCIVRHNALLAYKSSPCPQTLATRSENHTEHYTEGRKTMCQWLLVATVQGLTAFNWLRECTWHVWRDQAGSIGSALSSEKDFSIHWSLKQARQSLTATNSAAWVEDYSELHSRETVVTEAALDSTEDLPVIDELDQVPNLI